MSSDEMNPADTGARRTLAVDPQRSRFGFKATAFLLMPVKGTFRARGGTITIEDGRFSAHGVADATSVDTRIKPRDAHLRHKHYLWTKQHPEILLEVGDVPLDAETATAQLTARGQTVAVDLTLDSVEQSGGSLRVRASGAFDRVPLGMLPPLAGVSRQIKLDLDLVAN